MAKIGLMNPVYAVVKNEPENAAITYEKGKIFGKAISASVTFTSNDNPLYGDDTVIENDNSLTGAEITLGVDDILEEDQKELLGLATTGSASGSADTLEYQDANSGAPYVGVGYIQVRRKAGVVSYIGNWWHKVQFNRPDEETNTKGENIEWQTDTITGTAMGARIDTSGLAYFRAKKSFTTYAAALAWLKDKAGITEDGG